MSLDREQKVRGNLIPEGVVVPHSASWPPDAVDGQLHWHLPERQMYVYDLGLDSWVPVSIQQQYHFEPIVQDFANTNSRTLFDVRNDGSSNYFFNLMPSRNLIVPQGVSTHYEALWRHVYWQFAVDGNPPSSWTSPAQIPTEAAFFGNLEVVVPNNGVSYTRGVHFRVFEAVDDSDHYPNQVRHRNSLVASMRGGGSWLRGIQSGIDDKFNWPSYYLNFYNEIGQRFVTQYPAPVIPPATNDDGVVWYHRGSRGSLWRWPRVGSWYEVGPGLKTTAWDNVAGTYVSPAPAGYYTVQQPFFLVEHNAHMLSIVNSSPDYHQRERELWFPMALVFPVMLDDGGTPRYFGYVVVPHGSDSFITENVDPGNYDFFLCCKYRHTYRKMYVGPITQASFSDLEHSLFQLRHIPFNPRDAAAKQSVDKDSIPIQIDIARRNRSTGMRSPWFPAYVVNRRIHHAAFRVDPAPWRK